MRVAFIALFVLNGAGFWFLWRTHVSFGAGIDNENAVALADDHDFLVVMLVFNIADDHLNKVFQRHKSVGAAIFVNHQRHLDTRAAHSGHEFGNRHGMRHEQDFAHQVELGDCLFETHL